MKKIKIKSGRINWICLKEKCPTNCCSGRFLTETKNNNWRSFYGISRWEIPLTEREFESLPIDIKKFTKKLKDKGYYIKIKKDRTCPFLDKHSLCKIYNRRFFSCRAYPFFIDKYSGLAIDNRCYGFGKGWTNLKDLRKFLKGLIEIYQYRINKIKSDFSIK